MENKISLFKKIFSKEEPAKFDTESFQAMAFSRVEMPSIIEKKNTEFVWYGDDNLYPNYLQELLTTSAMHNAICVGKGQMMAGNGIVPKEGTVLTPDQQLQLDSFIDNGGDHLQDVIDKMSFDFHAFGQMACEAVWSLDGTRVALLKYVDATKIRAGKMENGRVNEYYYSRDWRNLKQNPFVVIPAFDEDAEIKGSQLIFVKHGTQEYYGTPSWQGCMAWINVDSQMSLFHLSNIKNGFAPSMAFKFYRQPANPEERQMIMTNIKKQFGGSGNAGKALIFFSDGKDLAPDIQAVETSNLDKQFLVLSELAAKEILSGHRVTSPLLFGISTPGQLGGNTELATSYSIFNNIVIKPSKSVMTRMLNKVLESSGYTFEIDIKEFNPTT